MIRSLTSINLLLLVAFLTDLLTPFLIWKGLLPAPVRWLSHLAVAIIISGCYVRMLVSDYIPGVVWLITGLSISGGTIAIMNGQGMIPTVWGWWTMFQFIFVALFAFLESKWPQNFPRQMTRFVAVILGAQVAVQLGQYLAGELPGDHLAGTFGEHGTDGLVLFILFAICLSLGQWIVQGKWKLMALCLVLGGISSVLGEMKLFPVACLAIGVTALVIQTVRGGQIVQLIAYIGILTIVSVLFYGFYNLLIVDGRGTTELEAYLDWHVLEEYLWQTGQQDDGNIYLGRGFALTLGWESIQKDFTTFWFGLGIGARGESVSLGTAGKGLTDGYYGLSTGTSLLVLMQEWGLTGLILVAAGIVWLARTVMRSLRTETDLDFLGFQCGLLLYALFWPLWLWYTTAWTERVHMFLFFVSVGYVTRRIALMNANEPMSPHADGQNKRAATPLTQIWQTPDLRGWDIP